MLDALKIDRVSLVTHDIGNMVAYAFAALFPRARRALVRIDAPVTGVDPWDKILKNPLLWHFRFGGPDMERLVAGRERIYLDRFWNEFSATPSRFAVDVVDDLALQKGHASQGRVLLLPSGTWHCPALHRR